MLKHTLLATLLTLAAVPAWAEWKLDNGQSHLSFISIKKSDVAEVHTFKELRGQVGADGKAEVIIELSSVDTKIPIRDERMKEFLFEVMKFPRAVLSAQLELADLEKLQAGEMSVIPLKTNLNLHGSSKDIEGRVAVTRITADKLQVVSYQPFVVTAADFALAEGVEKLREIAGLPSISGAVPVTFMLTFEQK